MKIKGFGLVLAIFIGFLFITWAFDTTGLAAIQRQYLHWNYSSHVVMIVVGIAAIAIWVLNLPRNQLGYEESALCLPGLLCQ